MTEDESDSAGGYRLFVLDDSGRVKSVPMVITALDDAAATHEAEATVAGRAAELWQGARLVAQFACKVKGQVAQQNMTSLLGSADPSANRRPQREPQAP